MGVLEYVASSEMSGQWEASPSFKDFESNLQNSASFYFFLFIVQVKSKENSTIKTTLHSIIR